VPAAPEQTVRARSRSRSSQQRSLIGPHARLIGGNSATPVTAPEPIRRHPHAPVQAQTVATMGIDTTWINQGTIVSKLDKRPVPNSRHAPDRRGLRRSPSPELQAPFARPWLMPSKDPRSWCELAGGVQFSSAHRLQRA